MALSKYVRSPMPASGDLRKFVDGEFQKLDNILAVFNQYLGAVDMLVGAQEGQALVTVIGTTTPGAAAYTNQTLSYTKIGRLVIITGRITWTGHTGTGNMQISTLPFAQIAGPATPLIFVAAGGPPNTDVAFVIGSIISVQTAGGAAAAPMTANGDLFFAGAYFAAS